MVKKENRQNWDGVWVTAHNGITQCASLQVDDLIPILSPAV